MRETGGEGVVVGIDEVGRGALAGPLTVGAVALPDEPEIVGVDDSKKLSPKRREELASQIREVALGVGIAHIPPDEIDACGMAASLRVAFSRALSACEADMRSRGTAEKADAVLVDGNPIHIGAGERNIVHGDAKAACIAAASIVAKVTRDALMRECGEKYPGYGFERNKGYGSSEHIEAIRRLGPTCLHRMSFLGNIVSEQKRLL